MVRSSSSSHRACLVALIGCLAWTGVALALASCGLKDDPPPSTPDDSSVDGVTSGRDAPAADSPADAIADAGAGLDATVGDDSSSDGDAPDAPTDGPTAPDAGIVLGLGSGHACALFPDGAVDCWGENDHGEMGAGYIGVDGSLPHGVDGILPHRVIGLGKVLALSTGSTAPHQCAIVEDAGVFCWGWNHSGEVIPDAATDAENLPTPTHIELGISPTSVYVGYNHTCATDRVQVWCWGWTNTNPPGGPASPLLAPPITQMSSGNDQGNCAITDAGLECWRDEDQTPAPPDGGMPRALQVAVGNGHSCAVTQTHDVYCWGSDWDNVGLLGVDPDGGKPTIPPTRVGGLADGGIAQVVVGEDYSCARQSNGDVYCWGAEDVTDGQRPWIPQLQAALRDAGPATQIWSGAHFLCAVVGSEVYCWGRDYNGQLGNGDSGADLGFVHVPL
jgi:alpha-tubulin suppressor-like RCC1 family protein